jgi:hypothetical protein
MKLMICRLTVTQPGLIMKASLRKEVVQSNDIW